MSRKIHHTTVQRWWHPDSLQGRRHYLVTRTLIRNALSETFLKNGFCEVETPALQYSPGSEPHLSAFATSWQRPGEKSLPRYLHSSPEFAMKKLLVAGETKIFQFAHVYRNNESSATHHPEFTMLEWYRAKSGYEEVIDDCKSLLRAAAKVVEQNFRWQNTSCDIERTWECLTVAEAFSAFAKIDLLATAPDPLNPDVNLLAIAASAVGIESHQGDSWDDLFFRIFFARIEPRLGCGQPTLLVDYPVSMAALARPKANDPRLAERFELYVAGLEIANGFGELTDVIEQRRRFEADMFLKQKLYGERYPIDEDFLDALDFGMPEASGVALGFDRLVMLATGATTIEDVLWAPVQ